MRGPALLLPIFLIGCTLPDHGALASKDCTPLIPQSELDTALKTRGNLFDKELATDCIMVKARRYAPSPDGAAAVAQAVNVACASETNSWWVDTLDTALNHNAAPHDAIQRAGVAEKDLTDTAIQYVVEARALHCDASRVGVTPPKPWWRFW